MRILYDASARANEKVPSLNDCLETGPTLQSKLPSVLIRNRSQPVALAGDLKQAFLPVRMREKDRDVMRLHWIKDLAIKQVESLRFTTALFGLSTLLARGGGGGDRPTPGQSAAHLPKRS